MAESAAQLDDALAFDRRQQRKQRPTLGRALEAEARPRKIAVAGKESRIVVNVLGHRCATPSRFDKLTMRATEIAGKAPILSLRRTRAGQGGLCGDRQVRRALRQVFPEYALVEFGDHRPLQLVAFVEEGQAECEAEITENLGVLSPGDHG